MRRHLASRVLAGFALVRKVPFRRVVVRALAGAYSLAGAAVTLRLGTIEVGRAPAGSDSLSGCAAALR